MKAKLKKYGLIVAGMGTTLLTLAPLAHAQVTPVPVDPDVQSGLDNLIAGIAGGVSSNFVSVLAVAGAIMIGILVTFFAIRVAKRLILHH